MNHRIENIESGLFTGINLEMSISHNRTGELWRKFRDTWRTTSNQTVQQYYSLQEYPIDYFKAFDPHLLFKKWALIEFETKLALPDLFEYFQLDGGLYVVFSYKGRAGNPEPFRHIFTEWLPASEYELDNRPHFEKLGSDYRPESDEAEEEIWIPIKLRV